MAAVRELVSAAIDDAERQAQLHTDGKWARLRDLLYWARRALDAGPLYEPIAQNVLFFFTRFRNANLDEQDKMVYEANRFTISLLTEDLPEDFLNALEPHERQDFYTALERIQLLDRAEEATDNAELSAERIKVVESHVRELAGETSATSLAAHYAQHARSEEIAANWLRAAAIGLALATAFAVVFIPIDSALSTAELFHRLAFSVPVILLSGYFAREAGQHRFVARGLRATEVKLKSLWAFADGLVDEDVRTSFLDRVGSTLFTAATAQPGEAQPPASLDQMDVMLQRITDLVREAVAKGR